MVKIGTPPDSTWETECESHDKTTIAPRYEITQDRPTNFESIRLSMTEEEIYQTLRQAFLDHCNDTDGPWRITEPFLAALYRKLKLPEPPPQTGKDRMIGKLWQRLVDDLCPVDIIIPTDFNIEERIAAVDDNTKTIFACGKGPFMGREVRILRLSSLAVAMLLRLAA